MKTIKVTRNGRPATDEELQAAVAGKPLPPVTGSDAEWDADSKDFDTYFDKQRYSLGAMPTWTQVEEMARTWCNARRTLREKQNDRIDKP